MNPYAIVFVVFLFSVSVLIFSIVQSVKEKKKEDEKTEKTLDFILNDAFVPVSEKEPVSEEKSSTPFVPKSAFGDGKCMYCGKVLNGIGSNPEDHGLHTKYINFSDKGVCPRCDVLVTQTNRYISWVLNGKPNALEMLRVHIHDIVENYEEISSR